MSDEQKKEAEENQDKSQEESGPKKNKKIKAMNLSELEKAIEKTEKNGGLFSKYAIELIKRRDFFKAEK